MKAKKLSSTNKFYLLLANIAPIALVVTFNTMIVFWIIGDNDCWNYEKCYEPYKLYAGILFRIFLILALSILGIRAIKLWKEMLIAEYCKEDES